MTFHLENSGRLKILTDAELAASEGDSVVIVYNRGKLEDGSPYWLYIAVKPSKYREYVEKTSKHEMITFSDYGEIIKYGYEESVPDDIRIEMEREYGCNENYLDTLTKKLRAEQVAFLNKKEDKRITDIVAMLKKKQAGN